MFEKIVGDEGADRPGDDWLESRSLCPNPKQQQLKPAGAAMYPTY